MLRHLLAIVLLLQAGPILADSLAGRVIAILDGATLTVLDKARARHTIRLVAVDAPEARQPFAREARLHLSGLLSGKEITVEWRTRDRYGRIVGKVMVRAPDCLTWPTCAQTLDAGLAQIEAGLAWWFRNDRREQSLTDQGRYEYAEFDAQARRIGLWRDAAPVPPWEWRKGNRILAQAIIAAEPLARRRGNVSLPPRANS